VGGEQAVGAGFHGALQDKNMLPVYRGALSLGSVDRSVPIRGHVMPSFAGNYPIEHRKGEIDRLHAQGTSLALDTRTMLDRIGVKAGWACLDLGCGPRGITDLLSERVGAGGRVVALDKDEEFVAYGRAHAPPNVEFGTLGAFVIAVPSSRGNRSKRAPWPVSDTIEKCWAPNAWPTCSRPMA
jgi:SAM-dependent methyltransferase